MGNCATQRTLSEVGWHEAQNIGAAMDWLDVPVGKVIASEYCRAWQTASLAFGRYEKNPSLNFQPAEEYTEAQTASMRDAMSSLLAARPADGSNTVLVGHDDPFEAATGIYPEPMGVAYVIDLTDAAASGSSATFRRAPGTPSRSSPLHRRRPLRRGARNKRRRRNRHAA